MPPVRQTKINTEGSVFPEGIFETGSYRFPIPANQCMPKKDSHLNRLVKKANKDASLKREVEGVLFFFEVPFKQIVFELGQDPADRCEYLVPFVRVKAQEPVSPLTWITAASSIATLLLDKGLGLFSVDIMPADKA